MKRIVFIIGIVFVIALIGLLVYSLLKRSPSGTQPPQSQTKEIESIATPERVFYPALSLDEKSILYLPGQELSLHKFNLETKKDASISPNYFGFVKNITWSPKKDKLIVWVLNNKVGLLAIGSPFINQGLGENAVLPYLFDLKSKKASPLSQNIAKAVFSADGQKIIYQYLDQVQKINNFSISEPDGTNWKTILDLKDENIFLSALGTGEIIFTTAETTDSFSILKIDGTTTKTVRLPIFVDVNKLVWSRDGKLVFVATREVGKTTDTIYKMDVQSGQKEEIKYQSKTPLDAKNLILTKDEKVLYFTSDDFLYKLEI